MKTKRTDGPVVREYMKEMNRHLTIKDPGVRDQLMGEISSRVREMEDKGKSIEEVRRAMGSPEEIGRTLSDPESWYVDMGTPMSPGVPIRSFLSFRGRMMLLGAFLFGMVLAVVLVLNGVSSLLVPSVIAVTLTLWMLMAAWFHQNLGYINTLEELSKGPVRVKYMKRREMSRTVAIRSFFFISLSIVTGASPFLFDMSGLMIPLLLSSITILGVLSIALLTLREYNKVTRKLERPFKEHMKTGPTKKGK